MEPSHDHIEKTLDKLVASTRSPRGRYSASESWKLLERRLVPPRTKRLRLFRLAGVVAASVLLCFASWFIYDYWKPVAMQTVSAGAAISVITLPDQTKVTLNRYSSLTYPDRFKEDRREVQLQGEAYFEVAPDSLHPFIVKTEQQNLRVLGTSFAIRAYANESVVLTTLETGKVNIHSKGQEVILTPGEQSCLKDGNLTVAKVNTTLFTAWHKGIFIFQDQPLENILNTLARWYNIDIFYTNENLKDIHFTGELKRYDRIQDFLCKLEILEKVRFTIKGRTVTVSTY